MPKSAGIVSSTNPIPLPSKPSAPPAAVSGSLTVDLWHQRELGIEEQAKGNETDLVSSWKVRLALNFKEHRHFFP